MFYIYIISNKINNKHYIGKTNNPIKRWKDHKNIAKNGGKSFYAIHAAIKKYGVENFIFDTLEEYDDELECYEQESYWIEFFETFRKTMGYNLHMGGRGGTKPTPEVIQKLIAFQNKPETKAAKSMRMILFHKNNPDFISNINSGRQFTDEHKTNLSKAAIGHKMPQKTREKLSQLFKDKNPVAKLTKEQVLEIRKKFEKTKYSYESIGREYGVKGDTIRNIVLRISWKHI